MSCAYRYRVLVGSGLLRSDSADTCASVCAAKTCAIISDSNVAPLFADRVKKSLIVSRISPDSDHDSGGREIEDA